MPEPLDRREADPRRLLEQFDAAWNAGDEERVMSFFADDVVIRVSVPPPAYLPESSAGKAAAREFVRMSLPGFAVRSTGHRVVGDTVTWRFACSADGLRRLGAEAVTGTGEVVVTGGRIRQFHMTVAMWEALREREAQYRGIFEATTDGLVIGDLEGRGLVDVNPAMCRMHGYTREEMLQLHPTQFIHPDYHAEFWSYVKSIRTGDVYQTRAVDVRKDGSLFHVEVRGTQFLYRGTPHVLGVVRDITEGVEAYQLLERRVEERTRELATLLEVSHDVASTLELRPLLSTILDRLRAVVSYTGASIASRQDDSLVILDARGPAGREHEALGVRIPAAVAGALWDAILQRQPVIVDDVRDDSPFARAFRAALGARLDAGAFAYVRSWLAVPLVARDRVVGMLTCSRDEPGYFRQRHAELALAFAGYAAVAIENARLHEQAQEKAVLEERQRLARELHDAVTQTLFSASLIADVLPATWVRDPVRAASRTEELRQLTRGALAEMRTLLVELRPNALAEADLGQLLRQLGQAVTGRTGVPVEVTVEGQPKLPEDVQVALYRVAQEALNNAARHAGATKVDVRLRAVGHQVELAVRDDGRGFEPRAVTAGHFGLGMMRERAEAIGARLAVASAPGRGTAVTLTWIAQTAAPDRGGQP